MQRLVPMVVLLALLSVACTADPDPTVAEYRPLEVEVVRVVDGDTAVLRWPDGRDLRVRFIGIDAPERADPLGPEATAFVRGLLPTGSSLYAIFDADAHDRYGRTLSYLYPRWPSDDEEMINARIVAAGWARTMTIPPNVSHADLFLRLQRQARTAKRGMWATEPFS